MIFTLIRSKMPLDVNYHLLKEKLFGYPFRIFISGSSQSGKTFFAERLLEHMNIFQHACKQVVYYHPDFLDSCPVNWHKTLNIRLTYKTGIPTLQDLRDLKNDTCVILDDLYEESVNAQSIDYLFRVLSGKKNLSVIIMSQRYFASGKFAMNIRNNCNFTVLMRNVDAKINTRIASLMSLQKPIAKAISEVFRDNFYPYLFIDSTPRGQVTNMRIYTDIFNKYQQVFTQAGMRAYVIDEKDFLANFKIRDSKTAENGIHTQNISKITNDSRVTRENSEETENDKSKFEQERNKLRQRAKRNRIRRKLKQNIQRR